MTWCMLGEDRQFNTATVLLHYIPQTGVTLQYYFP